MVAVLAFQLWRSFRLESQLQQTEIERALLLGERILQRTIVSQAAFAVVPAANCFEVRGDRVVVDPAVAWLDPIEPGVDDDLIVQDRLDRAMRAEFVDRDHASAAREFDELLAGPLLATQRLQVLSAALWHAKRSQTTTRIASLSEQFARALENVTPPQLASDMVSSALASAVRIEHELIPAAAAERLLPCLPPLQFAGLPRPLPDGIAARHRDATVRRDRMRLAQQWLGEHGATAAAGLHALTTDAVLWLMPAAEGQRRAAVLRPQAWFDAVMAEARDGATFSWPERIEPEFGSATEVAMGAVPGVARLRPKQSAALGGSVWLLPVLTGLLAVAFALAFVQHRRAGRRESEAMAAQSQFLTTVTHELKTPLAGIRLLGEMLAEGRAGGREAEYYKLLVGESARLSLLIDNVLDLGRLERGERSYLRTSVPLADLVRETLRMFAPVLEQHGMQVTFADELLDANASLDRDAFVQSLVAVLDNARKYGASGKRVEVLGAIDGDRLTVCVRDYGAGVPAAEREAVFDRFVRGQEHQHGSTPGVGIGLYLARSIARSLGGDLTCSAPASGDGAEFRFSLQRSMT